MNVSNPKVISALVSCTPQQLPQAAGRNGLKAAIASVVREHWIRRLTGVCVRCGYHTKKGQCPKCHTPAAPSLFLLEQLDPKDPIIRGQCRKCDKSLVFKAGYVLGVVKKRGIFRPQGLCPACLKAKRSPEVKKTPAPPPAKAKVPEKVVQPPAPTPKAKKGERRPPVQVRPSIPARNCEGTKPLTHRPFAALAGLKIENPQV